MRYSINSEVSLVTNVIKDMKKDKKINSKLSKVKCEKFVKCINNLNNCKNLLSKSVISLNVEKKESYQTFDR